MNSLQQLSSISKLLALGNHRKSDVYAHYVTHFAICGTSTPLQRLPERADRVDVLLWRFESRTHRVHRDVSGAEGAPAVHPPRPFLLRQAGDGDPRVDAETFPVAASFLQILFELLDKTPRIFGLAARRH